MDDALVTAAVLGTDRRPPPDPTPGAVHDVVADALVSDPAERLLVQLGTSAAQRLAASPPDPPVARLPPPVADDRAWCPLDVVAMFGHVVEVFPVLVDEWLVLVASSPWRLPPDVVVELLARSRSAPDRRARVLDAAGPVAGWLVDLIPALGRGRAAATTGTDPTRPGADEALHAVATATRSSSPAARRTTLERLLADLDIAALDEVADGLEAMSVASGWTATVEHLVALVRFRSTMQHRFADPDR